MKAKIPRVTGLPLFKCEDLEEIAVVWRGSFGIVLKASLKLHDAATVVVKKLSESED